MPAKKSKGAVGKTKKSHGKPGKSKANKSKIKASKRSAQAKKRKDKYREKQRKDRKKTDKAKRTAKKTAKGSKKPGKPKDKKKKDPKKPEKELPAKVQPNEDDEGGGGDEESGDIRLRFTGLSVPQMQDLRQKLVELSKDEFLEQVKNQTEGRLEEAKMQAAFMGGVENRMTLFSDQEQPTDSSRGPFQSNRFGAVFLLPGE